MIIYRRGDAGNERKGEMKDGLVSMFEKRRGKMYIGKETREDEERPVFGEMLFVGGKLWVYESITWD